MADFHKQQAITIYRESLRQHKQAVQAGVNPDGTDTWKGTIHHAQKIARDLIAPHIDKGNRELIKQKWLKRLTEFQDEIDRTPIKQRTMEMTLFNPTKLCRERYYSDVMVRRAIQLEIEI